MVNKVQRRKALPADYWKWLHSITAVLVFAQTVGWIANKVRLRIAANLPTRDKMNRPPRKAFGNFLCSIKYPKKIIPINSFSLVQAKSCIGAKIWLLQRLAVSSLAEQPHVYELAPND